MDDRYARGRRITFVYDNPGQVTGERYPTGRRNTYTFDLASNRTLSQTKVPDTFPRPFPRP